MATTLRENLSTIDETDSLMIEWFTTLGAVASSPAIQLENLSTTRRQRATVLYGDIRRKAAVLMADMWFGLGKFFVAFLDYYYILLNVSRIYFNRVNM